MEIEEKQISAKLSLTALLSGVAVSIALLFFTMSLAAAMGLWYFQLEDLALVGWTFWMVAIAAWALSTAIGSVIAVLGSASRTKVSAVIHSVVTWAGAYLVFGGMAVNITDLLTVIVLPISPERLLWAGFFGDALALVSSVTCGLWASQYGSAKARTPAAEPRKQAAPAAAFVPVGQYT